MFDGGVGPTAAVPIGIQYILLPWFLLICAAIGVYLMFLNPDPGAQTFACLYVITFLFFAYGIHKEAVAYGLQK